MAERQGENIPGFTPEQARILEALAHVAEREKYLERVKKDRFTSLSFQYPATPGYTYIVSWPVWALEDLVEKTRLSLILAAIDADDPIEKMAFEQDWHDLLEGKVELPKITAPDICPEGHSMAVERLYFACRLCKPPVIYWKKKI